MKFLFKYLLIIIIFVNMYNISFANNTYNMTYLYGTNTKNYKNYLEKTQNSINEVSPDFFEINDNGTLKFTSKLDKSFIDYLHNKGITVIPFISNHWNREIGQKALSNRDFLATQLVEAVQKYNLDGLNIDIENLTHNERDSYTDFIKILREKLPSNKTLSIAVAANPSGYTKGWHGSYDYAKLGKYCDYIIIMAYDESYEGSEIGPVASYSFVEESIKYALNFVSNDKIILAIPFYGRFWSEDGSIYGKSISLKNIENLLSNYSNNITYDYNSNSAKATIYINENDTLPTINSTTLNYGTYTFWYENESSIKSKIDLIHKYNLKGCGSWRLGQELNSTWNYLGHYLNGNTFYDINTHWAKENILNVFEKGWMTGIANNIFAPSKNITRAEAIVTLVRTLNLHSDSVDLSNTFDDSSKHWAKKEIAIAKSLNLIVGLGNNKFKPNQNMTRAEMATLLNRIFNISSSKKVNMFSDVNDSFWAYDSIINLSCSKILIGFDDGTFRPNLKMTRGEMATLLTTIDNSKILN